MRNSKHILKFPPSICASTFWYLFLSFGVATGVQDMAYFFNFYHNYFFHLHLAFLTASEYADHVYRQTFSSCSLSGICGRVYQAPDLEFFICCRSTGLPSMYQDKFWIRFFGDENQLLVLVGAEGGIDGTGFFFHRLSFC